MSISTKQALLLNNLIYLEASEGPFPDPEEYIGRTVKDWIDGMDIDALIDPDGVPLPMTTFSELRKIIEAAMRDPFLMKLKILDVVEDLSEEVACTNAIFLSDSTPDAIFVFRGTDTENSAAQWKDNFISANAEDTPQQINALRWYRQSVAEYKLSSREITVTGHSKGGNKAKYITILDNSVDHCISFNGEGFSDKFFSKYEKEILLREDRIRNHMVNYDYVSPLMNDVGDSIYYHGYDYGSGKFVENHMVNTFMKFDEDGDFHMEVDEEGRPIEIMALDEFVNSFLRSLEDERRTATLLAFGNIANLLMTSGRDLSSSEIALTVLREVGEEDSCRNVSYFAAYLIRYEQKYPVMIEFVRSVFHRFDMDDLYRYVELFAQIINWKKRFLWFNIDFTKAVSTVNRLRNRAPERFHRDLKHYLEKRNIFMLDEEIRVIERLVNYTEGYLRTIVIEEDSVDRRHFSSPAENGEDAGPQS